MEISKAQTELLSKLSDGWELRKYLAPLHSPSFKIKKISGHNKNELQTVNCRTVEVLEHIGFIQQLDDISDAKYHNVYPYKTIGIRKETTSE